MYPFGDSVGSSTYNEMPVLIVPRGKYLSGGFRTHEVAIKPQCECCAAAAV